MALRVLVWPPQTQTEGEGCFLRNLIGPDSTRLSLDYPGQQSPSWHLWMSREKTKGRPLGQGGRDSGYKALMSKLTGSGEGTQGGNPSSCSPDILRTVASTSGQDAQCGLQAEPQRQLFP